jgi:predicted ABC-type sugar transport system permease subunit
VNRHRLGQNAYVVGDNRQAAKLMGVPAVQIGKVGGDKLTVKTASGEFSAQLTELHDPWWNSIARAMA